jgi:hypothetical protein
MHLTDDGGLLAGLVHDLLIERLQLECHIVSCRHSSSCGSSTSQGEAKSVPKKKEEPTEMHSVGLCVHLCFRTDQ